MHIPPNWGIFFTLIVSFLVFWFIFDWLFFGPFLKLLGDREARLKSLAERTEHLLKEEKAANARREQELDALRREALERREAERRRAEAEAQKLFDKSKAEAKAAVEKVAGELRGELQAAEAQLEELSRKLGAELAERVLGRSLAGPSK